MADEENNNDSAPAEAKCEECKPGLPEWMATFSDLVTLLLTFFVLLLSFAKTETSKYQAALGSIRKAFGGNVRFQGEVLQPGKSPDDSPTMIDSQEPVKPFPIDFLTTEGLLDKHEINRGSEEKLGEYKALIKKYELSEDVAVYEENEGLKVEIKDKVYFEEGNTKIINMNQRVLNRVINMVRDHDWVVFVSGYAAKAEKSRDGKEDAYQLSARRATVISKFLIQNGVKAEKIVTVSYGDSRQQKVVGAPVSESDLRKMNRIVEFMIRKRDLNAPGHKVDHY